MRRGEKEPSEKERGERKIKRYAALQPKEREKERESSSCLLLLLFLIPFKLAMQATINYLNRKLAMLLHVNNC